MIFTVCHFTAQLANSRCTDLRNTWSPVKWRNMEPHANSLTYQPSPSKALVQILCSSQKTTMTPPLGKEIEKFTKLYESSHLIQGCWQESWELETGHTYPASQMSKNRARKGRGWELPGPDWQLQSASSSPAWQGDRHSRGCDGPPCASGGCRSNLAGKSGEPSRGCWRFDKKQQLCEEICTNKWVDAAQAQGGYSCKTAPAPKA